MGKVIINETPHGNKLCTGYIPGQNVQYNGWTGICLGIPRLLAGTIIRYFSGPPETAGSSTTMAVTVMTEIPLRQEYILRNGSRVPGVHDHPRWYQNPGQKNKSYIKFSYT